MSDPHTYFADVAERGGVVWSQAHRAWLITRYHDVVEAFRDTETLSSDRLTPLYDRLPLDRSEVLAEAFDILRGWMVFHDAPRHMLLREPVRRAFTPRMIQGLQPKIEGIVEALLDDLTPLREFDFKEMFAFPLPAIVISALLDIPSADRERFRDWSAGLATIVFGESRNPDQDRLAAQGAANFVDYFSWLVAKRKAEPGDDLLSALVLAQSEDPAVGLTNLEVLGASTLMLFAGHETTTNFLTNAMLSLLRHSDQADALRTTPDMVGTAVDELLRYDGPVKVMVRSVARTHERCGQDLQAGQTVFLAVAAANRDPGVFADPHLLDLTRTGTPHISFGQGPHHCLGSSLARLESRIALPAVLRRLPHLRACDEPLVWEKQILVRAVKSLPVVNPGAS
ncbi:cytochrome P450 [Rhodococcus sp. ABRD24]|uniref:cytochrome P450 n=1 Tax=Rhodococcus sp. ABRD24 TaxID=2507582 RepID=UPI0013F155C6|nr:cytochrome P450 [Rhodococcus sp. ABRD24]